MKRIETAPQGMSIEDEGDFENIKNGRKTIEVKIGQPAYINFEPGDRIIFRSKSGEEIEVKVNYVSSKAYKSFKDLIALESLGKIFPDLSKEEAVEVYQNRFPAHFVEQYGLVAIEFEVVNKGKE
jgi:ASC-1-like (ASCH) protein